MISRISRFDRLSIVTSFQERLMEVGPPGACDTRYPQAGATVGVPFDDAIQGEQFTLISDLWKLVVDITMM